MAGTILEKDHRHPNSPQYKAAHEAEAKRAALEKAASEPKPETPGTAKPTEITKK